MNQVTWYARELPTPEYPDDVGVSRALMTHGPSRRSLAIGLVALVVVVAASVVLANDGPFLGTPATPSASAASPRCAITPDGAASATIMLIHQEFGEPVTVTRGEAVAFSNQTNTTHTITEGTFGTAVPGACVNTTLRKSRDLIVTFSVAGDYPITCRRHPSMHTAVHVTPAASP